MSAELTAGSRWIDAQGEVVTIQYSATFYGGGESVTCESYLTKRTETMDGALFRARYRPVDARRTFPVVAPPVVAPRPGSRWRHRKGGLYVVMAVATMEADASPYVVYRPKASATPWLRPLAEFMDGRFTEEPAPLEPGRQWVAFDGTHATILWTTAHPAAGDHPAYTTVTVRAGGNVVGMQEKTFRASFTPLETP